MQQKSSIKEERTLSYLWIIKELGSRLEAFVVVLQGHKLLLLAVPLWRLLHSEDLLPWGNSHKALGVETICRGVQIK